MPDSRYEAFRLSLGQNSSSTTTTITATTNTMENLTSIPLSFATVSIGYKPEHNLPKKLQAITSAGFTGIELGFPDLLAYANQQQQQQTHTNQQSKEIGEYDYPALCQAAQEVKSLCASLNLRTVMLQPFSNFEGCATHSPERANALKRAKGWMEIMSALGTDMLQIGSSDSPSSQIGTDRSRFVRDLQELADELAQRNMRIAYENWCWSTHAPKWEDIWDICRRVNRPNFGLCLDTFQSAGGEYGDPTTRSGHIEEGGRSREQLLSDWKASCKKLSETIPKEKIFILQISDAYKPAPSPLPAHDIDGMRPRSFWSHAYRPLPLQEAEEREGEGGYLPVVDFVRAVLQTGFRGWFSTEVFDAGPEGKGREYDLQGFAEKARRCHDRLIQACKEERW